MRLIRFAVTSEVGGNVEVFVAGDSMRHYEGLPEGKEREDFVKHEAWRNLWNSPAKKMLQGLCDRIGVDKVKNRFNELSRLEILEQME